MKLAYLVLTALTAATPQLAHADTAVAPKPQHDPENISQINGQLVEVGNHYKFDHSYKRVNLAIDPFGWASESFAIQGSYALNHMVALRGDLVLGGYATDFQLTTSAAFYFRQMYSGLYFEPGVRFVQTNYDDEYYAYSHSGSDGGDTHIGMQTLLGYHWIWDSGLNAAVAFGGGRDTGSDHEYATGYIRVGYAF